MNQLNARVQNIDHIDNLHLVILTLGKQTIKMVCLALNESIKVGEVVQLSVKSTSISLAKNFTGLISYANQLSARVTAVNNGALLSSVQLDMDGFALESLITLEVSLAMNLCVGDEVVVLVRGSEVSVCG